jgi:hypothetical protein
MPFGHERMDLINELVIEFAEQFGDSGLGFFCKFGDFDVQINLGSSAIFLAITSFTCSRSLERSSAEESMTSLALSISEAAFLRLNSLEMKWTSWSTVEVRWPSSSLVTENLSASASLRLYRVHSLLAGS